MNHKTVFTINAIIALIYGLSYQFAPNAVLGLYGVTQGDGPALLARFFGAALIGIGLLTWFSRNVKDAEALGAITLSMFIYFAIGFVICVHGTLSGAMSSFGWTGVAVFLVLGLGFGYLQFTKPSTS
jgi:hypothetical protein